MSSRFEKVVSSKNDIEIRVTDPSKNIQKLIEWNLDMKVTLPIFRGSTLIQRTKRIFIFVTMIIFVILLSHLKGEIRALQVQMQGANANLVILMFKYDKLCKNFNRIRLCRSCESQINKVNSRNILQYPIKTDWTELNSNFFKNSNENFRMNSIKFGNVNIIPVSSVILSEKESSEESSTSAIFPKTREIINSREVDVEKNELVRARRSLLQTPRRNVTTNTQKRLESSHENEESLERDDSRITRSRRDEGRGKKWRKNKRRPKRSRRRLGPSMVTFIGAVPEQHVINTVHVGPWVKSVKNDSRYNFNKFHLVEDKKSIEVTMDGLYMISTQIYYFGEHTHHSYWILLNSEGSSITQKLVKCATVSAVSDREVSCYTSIVVPLHKGDRLHIQQQECNRLINLREGHSYIQLVLLSSDVKRQLL